MVVSHNTPNKMSICKTQLTECSSKPNSGLDIRWIRSSSFILGLYWRRVRQCWISTESQWPSISARLHFLWESTVQGISQRKNQIWSFWPGSSTTTCTLEPRQFRIPNSTTGIFTKTAAICSTCWEMCTQGLTKSHQFQKRWFSSSSSRRKISLYRKNKKKSRWKLMLKLKRSWLRRR